MVEGPLFWGLVAERPFGDASKAPSATSKRSVLRAQCASSVTASSDSFGGCRSHVFSVSFGSRRAQVATARARVVSSAALPSDLRVRRSFGSRLFDAFVSRKRAPRLAAERLSGRSTAASSDSPSGETPGVPTSSFGSVWEAT